MTNYFGESVSISAPIIIVGRRVTFGRNINISLRRSFSIGDYSHLGDDVTMTGDTVTIGKHLYHSTGLRVGGGGSNTPYAILNIGDRCTLHNNYLNLARPIIIGNDVGLSEDVSLITHGYWLSALEGNPARFDGINIGDGVIIGHGSTVLMGVNIGSRTVVGAGSVVTKDIGWRDGGVYAGNPARFIADIVPLSIEQREKKLEEIINEYAFISKYHGIEQMVYTCYPIVYFKDFEINVETFKYSGTEDEETDDFRDFMRKWGIRIYTERPFKSKSKTQVYQYT